MSVKPLAVSSPGVIRSVLTNCLQAVPAKHDVEDADPETVASAMVSELASKKEEWAYLDLSKKIAILREISDRTGERQVGQKIAMEQMKARRIDPTTPQGTNTQRETRYHTE